jgi:hypothetical protein
VYQETPALLPEGFGAHYERITGPFYRAGRTHCVRVDVRMDANRPSKRKSSAGSGGNR